MDVLSPRSANVPMKPRPTTKKSKTDLKPKVEEKPSNPDRIDDKWRPPVVVPEPGSTSETYITGKKLGKGGFAVCFEGKTKHTSELFALKVVKAHIEQKKMLEKFRTELQIHAKMAHPNIVQFHRAFTFEDHTYVILELCHNGNLTDMVKARSCLSLPEVRRFMIQTCGGVKYMHKRNVIHRDLKMGNIFLDSQMNIKIGDFGLAAVMADEQDRRTTLCGTPNYIAPEILSKSSTRGHDNKVDTWAIGVICYAMLMGTPPFQSKTQQEIYTKLKTLEYEWKIDSKNYIPQAAKDFVASCLTLVSAERPEMDDLVEHDFFKTGAIADTLDSSCLKTKPMWLLEADPRGDRVRGGYGVDHGQMCRLAGVGRTADGRSRPAAGEKANISALVEIEAENRRDCAPTVPLPEGILYKQILATAVDLPGLQMQTSVAQPRSRKLPGDTFSTRELSRAIEEVDEMEGRAIAVPPTLSSRTVPTSRSMQSFAAQQRQQAIPHRSTSRTVEASKSAVNPVDPARDEEVPPKTRSYLRERPVRAASIRTTRSTVKELMTDSRGHLTKSNTVPGRLHSMSNDKVATDSVDMPPPTRRTVGRATSRAHLVDRPAPTSIQSTENAITRPSSPSPSSKALDFEARVFRPTTANDRQAPSAYNDTSKSTRTVGESTTSYPSSIASQPYLTKPRLISSSCLYTILPGSSANLTLSSLHNLHDALLPPTASFKTSSKPHSRSGLRTSSHPRVDKWVDYSTRHGIAYILSDDTVGLVLKSNDDNSKPSACVVMRNGKSHTIRRAKGLEGQLVPQDRASEVEFYEREPEGGMKELRESGSQFKLDLKKYDGDSQAALVGLVEGMRGREEAERAKVVGLLDKFGKYMNKVSEGDAGDEEEDSRRMEENGAFVEFYQRLGNVGVWGFRSKAKHGGISLQFNFPDHTKLIVYQDDGEWMVDIVHLEACDARDLAKRGGGLTLEAFERRGVMTATISNILHANDFSRDRVEEETIKANELREKMSWIRGVVGCWIKNGGMGAMGDGESARIGWSGLQEKREGSRVKLCWGTVGRIKGDGVGMTTGSKK